jgi:hypothetical protein
MVSSSFGGGHVTRQDERRPTAAERARTIATRPGRATLAPAGDSCRNFGRLNPVMHHVHEDGRAALVLPDDDPLVAASWQAPRGELTVILEIADMAPVALREPTRGLLWLTGWLRPLNHIAARTAAVRVAEERPDPRLLDVGHGMSLLRLHPINMVLADADGTSPVDLDDFGTTCPDPFCRYEESWLRHLEVSHRDVVAMLARHLPDELRGGHVRPLGLDRFGLRLRVEAVLGDHDIRLPFARPVRDADELAVELHRLVGCPFLAGPRR